MEQLQFWDMASIGSLRAAVGGFYEHWGIPFWHLSQVPRLEGIIRYTTSYFRKLLKSLRIQTSLCLYRSLRKWFEKRQRIPHLRLHLPLLPRGRWRRLGMHGTRRPGEMLSRKEACTSITTPCQGVPEIKAMVASLSPRFHRPLKKSFCHLQTGMEEQKTLKTGLPSLFVFKGILEDLCPTPLLSLIFSSLILLSSPLPHLSLGSLLLWGSLLLFSLVPLPLCVPFPLTYLFTLAISTSPPSSWLGVRKSLWLPHLTEGLLW